MIDSETSHAEEVARAATPGPEPIGDGELQYFRLWSEGDDDGTELAHPMARLIARIDGAEALLRSKDERIAELEELLCWHATPQFEEDHRLSKGGDCWFCAELWPCPTQRAEDALADHTCPPAALASTPDDQEARE